MCKVRVLIRLGLAHKYIHVTAVEQERHSGYSYRRSLVQSTLAVAGPEPISLLNMRVQRSLKYVHTSASP